MSLESTNDELKFNWKNVGSINYMREELTLDFSKNRSEAPYQINVMQGNSNATSRQIFNELKQANEKTFEEFEKVGKTKVANLALNCETKVRVANMLRQLQRVQKKFGKIQNALNPSQHDLINPLKNNIDQSFKYIEDLIHNNLFLYRGITKVPESEMNAVEAVFGPQWPLNYDEGDSTKIYRAIILQRKLMKSKNTLKRKNNSPHAPSKMPKLDAENGKESAEAKAPIPVAELKQQEQKPADATKSTVSQVYPSKEEYQFPDNVSDDEFGPEEENELQRLTSRTPPDPLPEEVFLKENPEFIEAYKSCIQTIIGVAQIVLAEFDDFSRFMKLDPESSIVSDKSMWERATCINLN